MPPISRKEVKSMEKAYMVEYMKKGLFFHEHQIVFADNRKQAIQIMKNQFGSANIKILRCCLYENYYK